jgi:hypothetical protein
MGVSEVVSGRSRPINGRATRKCGAPTSVGDGIGENPAGYPPHAQYRFEMGPRTGVVILTIGPHTVYYSRTVSTAFQYGVYEVSEGGPSDVDRLAYLRAMLGPGWISGKTKG